MMKKILINLLIITLGLITSLLIESHLRKLIQTLFKTLTGNAIHFYGKDFYLFASPYYYICFGLFFLIIWISWTNQSSSQKILNGLLTIVIFLLSLMAISWLDGTLKIVECTACNDGRRGIHYNDINYDGIIMISLAISIIPTVILLIKKMPPTSSKIATKIT